MPQFRRRWHLLAISTVLLLAFTLRVWGITWGLRDATVSRRPHPDEWVLYWVFHWFDMHHAMDPCPKPLHQCFYDWGAAYLYLSYLARAALKPVWAVLPSATFGSHSDPEFVHAVLAGRAVSVVLATLTVLVVYRAGVAIRSREVGLLASTAVALAGLLAQLAHFATPDATTIFLMSASLLTMVLAMQRPSAKRFAVAGILVGLSAGSEYHMVLLLIPLTVAWLQAADRNGKWLAIALGCSVLAWIAVNPYAVAQPAAFMDANIHSIRIRTVASAAQDGDRWSRFSPEWLYIVRFPLGYGVGIAMTAWLVMGVGWAAARREKATLVLMAWIVPYFALVTVSPVKYMRYSAPLLPALSLLAACLLSELLRTRERRVRVVAATAAVIIALYSVAYDSAYARLFTQTDARQLATSWLIHNAPAGADIGFEQIPDGLVNLPYFVTDAGFRPCFSSFDAVSLAGPNRYFVVDEYSLEQHPEAGMSRVRAFRTALNRDKTYQTAFHAEHAPSFLGFTFSIEGSPHDWRYPARDITIFKNLKPSARSSSRCYSNLRSALVALRVKSPVGAAGATSSAPIGPSSRSEPRSSQ